MSNNKERHDTIKFRLYVVCTYVYTQTEVLSLLLSFFFKITVNYTLKS